MHTMGAFAASRSAMPDACACATTTADPSLMRSIARATSRAIPWNETSADSAERRCGSIVMTRNPRATSESAKGFIRATPPSRPLRG